MKALTVCQPWAWAIIHGGKLVENRTSVWSHRGDLAIHAGKRVSDRGVFSPLVVDAWRRKGGAVTEAIATDDVIRPSCPAGPLGAIIGIVTLVDVHISMPGCCDSPWAETSYQENGGKTRRDITHLVLENPRPVTPVPCLGKQSLWNVPPDIEDQVVFTDRDDMEWAWHTS